MIELYLIKIGDIEGGIHIDKSRVYTFLAGDVLTKLDEIASAQKQSRSELIRLAVEHYISNLGREDITTKEQEISHLKELIAVKDGELIHLRSLSNDLRSLADVLAQKVPALPPSQEEARAKHWWQFWR